MTINTVDILRLGAKMGASDIHLVPGAPPMARVNGLLQAIPRYPVITPEECAAMIYQLANEEQRSRFEKEWTLDFSFTLDDIRFRSNVLLQRNGMESILRIIPSRIPSPEELMLTPVIMNLTELHRGLVLVTGPTGSGKTTTLASLINVINQKRRGNIITIEDPIEFIYSNKASIVSQREIGTHSPSFASALKYVLRQDPDIVLIGELRDYETIAAALTVAETGHLVFATLHTVDAAQSIDRVIDVFPSRQQQQVRTQLAGVLKAVISQMLIPKANDNGRVAAREVMIGTPAVANLIRQGKTHELYSAIEMGANSGMISLDRALEDLVRKGLIDPSEALSHANNPDVTKNRSSARG